MKYLLLQVNKWDSSIYRYVGANLGLSYTIPLGNPSVTYRTKLMARRAVNKLRSEGAQYPSLYGIGNYRWEWDLLKNHPGYVEYLAKMKEYRLENERIDKIPVLLRPNSPKVPCPQLPHGTDVPAVSANLTANSVSTSYVNSNMSTSDDYNKLAIQISDLNLRVTNLTLRIDSLTDACDDELEAQKAALVAFGNIIKGMDDRLEDLEHNLKK
jgi:hypothetical protein